MACLFVHQPTMEPPLRLLHLQPVTTTLTLHSFKLAASQALLWKSESWSEFGIWRSTVHIGPPQDCVMFVQRSFKIKDFQTATRHASRVRRDRLTWLRCRLWNPKWDIIVLCTRCLTSQLSRFQLSSLHGAFGNGSCVKTFYVQHLHHGKKCGTRWRGERSAQIFRGPISYFTSEKQFFISGSNADVWAFKTKLFF